MNLTAGATFLMVLIKRAKSIINQKIKVTHDKKQQIRETEIRNGRNTQTVHILHEKRDGKFIFTENFLNR